MIGLLDQLNVGGIPGPTPPGVIRWGSTHLPFDRFCENLPNGSNNLIWGARKLQLQRKSDEFPSAMLFTGVLAF